MGWPLQLIHLDPPKSESEYDLKLETVHAAAITPSNQK